MSLNSLFKELFTQLGFGQLPTFKSDDWIGAAALVVMLLGMLFIGEVLT